MLGNRVDFCLKQGAVYLHELSGGFITKAVIREWVTFYNSDRPHKAIRLKIGAYIWQFQGFDLLT